MTEPRMTNAEVVGLCRMAKAACPQQQFDQYTPDMWHELLGDLRFEDARAALVDVVKSQPFVSPAEIRDQVKRIRGKRLDAFGPILPPFELEGNPPAESQWIREMVRRVGDGEVLPGEAPQIREVLGRVMPDWDRVLPAPDPMTKAEIVAKSAQKPDHRQAPGYKDRLSEVKAELAARGPIAMSPPEDDAPDAEVES